MLPQSHELKKDIIVAAKEVAEQGLYKDQLLHETKTRLEEARFPIHHINDILSEIKSDPDHVAENLTEDTLTTYLEANHPEEMTCSFREAIFLSMFSK